MRSIRVVTYEHEQLVVGCPVNLQGGGQTEFTEAHFEVLARYCGRQEAPPFRLGHRTIIIGHHVGYLRVGPVTLQIYPKLRRQQDADWSGLLLDMLRVVKGVRLRAQELAGLDASVLAQRERDSWWVNGTQRGLKGKAHAAAG